MNAAFVTFLDRLEDNKVKLLDRINQVPSSQLDVYQNQRDWPILLLLDHIIAVEELPISSPVSPTLKSSMRSRLIVSMLCRAMDFSVRSGVRMPTLPVFEPSTNSNLPQLTERWRACRQNVKDRLSNLDSPHSIFANHPVAGPISAAEYLRLIDIHLAYHLKHFPIKLLDRSMVLQQQTHEV
jgi:hypothetical protein